MTTGRDCGLAEWIENDKEIWILSFFASHMYERVKENKTKINLNLYYAKYFLNKLHF